MASDPKDQKPSIEAAPDGPYLVKGLETLRNSKGDNLDAALVIALCRCGGSANKPFCDGAHAKNGFSGERQTDGSLDKRDDYVGAKITIHDNRGICAHAGVCTDNLATVFRLQQEPWIDPDGAEADAIIEIIRRCPSGALSYSIDGVEQRDRDEGPSVMVSKDGPYFVAGDIKFKDESQTQKIPEARYALCRCGGSKNKPLCDGTHWSIEFKDEKN